MSQQSNCKQQPLTPRKNRMTMKSKMRLLLAGALVCAAGVANAQTSNSIVTFSVDMGTNILLGTFVSAMMFRYVWPERPAEPTSGNPAHTH